MSLAKKLSVIWLVGVLVTLLCVFGKGMLWLFLFVVVVGITASATIVLMVDES